MMGGLTWIDWTIVAIYASSTLALGWYFSRRQNNTQEYFVGSGNMNSILVGVSLFATLLSTISYLSMPGEVLGKGPVYMTNMLALPVVFLIVGYGLLPIYMRYRVTSAYELLEARLGLSVRMLGVVMFLTLRLVWMSLLVYLTAKALTVMIGVGENWIPVIVLATGLVSVTYASLGGMRAVVITDLMQTILLFGGAVLVIVVVSVDFGGFGWFPTHWQTNWDKQPLFSLDPTTRVTFFGALLTVLVWQVCTAGGDQVSVQRFMSTKDAGAARRSFATQMIVSIVVQSTLCLVGFALLAFFNAHPESIPEHLDLKKNADKIFPHFIAFHLPVGVSGLVVSAMFAAAMSSIDSGVNSITAVVTTDLLDRFGKKPKSERTHFILARALAFGIGATVVVGSMFVGQIPGNITEVTNKTVNLMVPMIFALFFFALFVPFAKPAAVWIGWLCGTTTAILIGFSTLPIAVYAVAVVLLLFTVAFSTIFMLHSTLPSDRVAWLVGMSIVLTIASLLMRYAGDLVGEFAPISFQWIGPTSLVVNLSVGLVASLLLPAGRPTRNPTSLGDEPA